VTGKRNAGMAVSPPVLKLPGNQKISMVQDVAANLIVGGAQN